MREEDTESGNHPSTALKYSINEYFGVTELSASVKAKWGMFTRQDGLGKHEQRAKALKSASFYMYNERRLSPMKQRRVKLADMRGKAAAAAAALASSQSDSERSAVLAARMLANMQAAEQRRLEAQQARHEKLASKNELVFSRLAQSQSGDQQRRQQLLQQLKGRLAHADEVRKQTQEQQQHQDNASLAVNGLGQLKQLVAVHGIGNWSKDLSPKTASRAAAFCAIRSTRRLQRCWRRFASQRKTTAQLAAAFVSLGVANVTVSSASAPQLTVAHHSAAAAASPTDGSAVGSPSSPVVMIGGMSQASSPKHARFEDFAAKLQSPTTLRTAQALLRRLEQRLAVRGVCMDGAQGLLRQLSPSAPPGKQLERYPVRVMLCAYMIRKHPEVVFSTVGDVEARLSAAAARLLNAFEALLLILVQPITPGNTADNSGNGGNSSDSASGRSSRNLICPSPLTRSMTNYVKQGKQGLQPSRPAARQLFAREPITADAKQASALISMLTSQLQSGSGSNTTVKVPATGSNGSCSSSVSLGDSRPISRSGANDVGTAAASSSSSLASLLVAFDDCWLEYLDQFVVWKGHDAVSLERELMGMAVRLERSMRLKLGRRELDSPDVTSNPDLQAMISQVSHDHALLAERIAHLTGPDGSARLTAALEVVRQQVAAELQAQDQQQQQLQGWQSDEQAVPDGSEVSWETASDAPAVSRSPSRPSSRATSMRDSLSDAEALAAAQRAAQQQQRSRPSAPASPTPAATRQAGGPSNRATPAEGDGGLSNEAMVWEMLYNPAYSLPTADAEAAWTRALGKEASQDIDELDPDSVESMTPEQLTAMVASRARTVAERAFWDSIVWRFETAVQGQALPSQLAPMMSELGTELSGFVPDSMQAQQLNEQYNEAVVLARLNSRTGQQGGGANLTAVGAMLEQLAQVLLQAGSTQRAAQAADAVQKLRASVAAALEAAAIGQSTAEAHGSSSANSMATGSSNDPEASPAAAAALAEALAAALRLLMAQLKLVKLDAANVRLAALASAMRDTGAVAYLQSKLATAWGLGAPTAAAATAAVEGASQQELGQDSSSEQNSSSNAGLTATVVANKLQRTAAWVAEVQDALVPRLRTGLTAAGLLLDQQPAAAAVVAGGLLSIELRSGVRRILGAASPGASNRQQQQQQANRAASPHSPLGPIGSSPVPVSPGAAAGGGGATVGDDATADSGMTAANRSTPSAATAAVRPVFPVTLDSWRGVVRSGLLALVTADTPAAGPELPEILTFDRARLHELQNRLQALMIAAAGLLIVQQLRQAGGQVWDAAVRRQARRRLLVMLADPGMKLTHLMAELCQLAGMSGAAAEQRVMTMFTTIVNPEAAAFNSIRTALTTTLAAHLLYGRAAVAADSTLSPACSGLLGRVGAAALADDVGDVAERLTAVAAVTEAVHGDLLALLASSPARAGSSRVL